jgi:hypothetical protein
MSRWLTIQLDGGKPPGSAGRLFSEAAHEVLSTTDLPRAAPSRIYALSVGEMRRVAELRDAGTGALIARVLDY